MKSIELNEQIHKGGDKVQAFRWSIVDAPGALRMIDKTELFVDHDYQRDISSSDMKVKRIASEWSWIAFGAIIVGDRDGVLHVIDGQHRVQAAMKRSDVRLLPCIVFQTQNTKQEAIGFLRSNRNRKPMSFIHAFKAMIAAGDPVAIKADALIASFGRTVSRESTAGTFTAVRALMDCIELDEDAARRSMKMVIALCNGAGVHQQLIHAAFNIERRSAGETLSDQYWIQKATRIGRDSMLKSINAAIAFRGGSGIAVWTEGMLIALNKGQRTKIFRLQE